MKLPCTLLCAMMLLPGHSWVHSATILRTLQSKPTGIIQNALQRLFDFVETKNVSQHTLWAIGNVTPPIDRTPGLNDVTRIFNLLPEDFKTDLVNSLPDNVNFPTTAFWEKVAEKWSVIEKKSGALHDALESSGLLDRAREVVKRYNQLMEWRTDAPFAVYDAKVEGFRNVTQPFYDTRTKFIESRDAVLDSLMNRQKSVWEPVVNKSEAIGTAIQNRREQLSDHADRLMLGRFSKGIYDIRSILLRFNTNRQYLTKAAKMCALNPICCNAPEKCVPTELNEQFPKMN